jgi:hypothetical protein
MIHIIQCLCPQRHCVLAVAYDPADMNGAEAMLLLKEGIESMIFRGIIDPWCGLCDSCEFHYEDNATVWASMEEAKPKLEKQQAAQMAMRAFVLTQREKATRN